MKAKLFEIQVGTTFLSVMAIEMKDNTSKNRQWLIEKALDGYSCLVPPVAMHYLAGGGGLINKACWDDVRSRAAHHYIEREFDSLEDGDVIDVTDIASYDTVVRRPCRRPT